MSGTSLLLKKKKKKIIINLHRSSSSRICRAPSMTCPPAQRGPWVRASALQGCPAVRASRATLPSRPSLRTLRPTSQAYAGPRHHLLAPPPASPPPAPALCPLLLCQVMETVYQNFKMLLVVLLTYSCNDRPKLHYQTCLVLMHLHNSLILMQTQNVLLKISCVIR